MKFLLAPLFFGLSGLALLAGSADAQLPFSSTAPPSPFNRFNSASAPAQPGNNGQQPGSAPGQYPPAAMPPGYAYQALPMSGVGVIDPNHKLGRQDSLSYRVAEDRDDKVYPLMVQDSGDVEVPLIGRVKAAGKTVSELTGDIKVRLESEYYYHATVSLGLDRQANHSSGRVFITGELKNGGALDLPAEGQLTVSEAILQMGGPTDDSNLGHVQVIRKGINAKGYVEVDVDAVLKGHNDKDFVLQDRDTVKVKKKLFGIKF